MAFCYKCGNELRDDGNFCVNCGARQNEDDTSNKRKQEYVGSVKKCPSCGEEIKALTAVCPACGHEFNSIKVNSKLEEFSKKVNEYEEQINTSPSKKTGFSSWSNDKKTIWIVINIFMLCIPLIYYYLFVCISKIASPFKKAKLSSEEKKLYTFIQNYQVPNEKESILELLLYIKGKVRYLSTNGSNKLNSYWVNIWSDKAKELKQKSDILFPNDEIVREAYGEIVKIQNDAKKKLLIKTSIIAGIIIIYLVVGIIVSSNKLEAKRNTILKLPNSEIIEKIPKLDYKYGKVTSEYKDHVSIEIYQVTEEDFENYVLKCRKEGYNLDVSKYSTSFKAKNDDGYIISIYYNSDSMEIDLYNE